MKWLIAALICVLAPAANAALQTNIGVLTCTLAETGDKGETPPSQTRAMLCAFKPNGSGPEEHYSGEIKNVGSGTALTGKLVLIWVVMGPEHATMEPGLLAQTYMGELAPSEDGKSKAPKMLVGDSDETYALRPLNEGEGETGGGGANNITVIVLKVKSTAA
jgi:hypothetical protein